MHPRIKAFQAFLGDAIKGPVGGGIIAATAVEEHPKGDGETSEKEYEFGSPHQFKPLFLATKWRQNLSPK
ncbi:hypothetical protein ACGYLA_01290 [Sulfitobacter sp. 1A13679]|jgi:hypothetical protein